INVVDQPPVSAWRFMGELIARGSEAGTRVPIPLAILTPLVALANRCAPAVLGQGAKLPSLLVPERFAQGYRSLRYGPSELHRLLGSRTPLGFAEATRRTFRTPVEGSKRL